MDRDCTMASASSEASLNGETGVPVPPSGKPLARLALLAVAALVVTGCGPGRKPRDLLRAHLTAFPAAEPAVIDLPTRAWNSGVGQLEALAEFTASARHDAPLLVEIGGAWCRPCVVDYAPFVKAARSSAAPCQFVHLGLELDSPDSSGLKAFITSQWNGGVEPTFPAFVLLDSRLRPLSPMAFNDLEVALASARLASSASLPATSAAPCGTGPEAYAAFLARVTPTVVDLDTRTMADFASALGARTHSRIIVDSAIADRMNSFRGTTLHLGAFATLKGPYSSLAIPHGLDDEPTLVLFEATASSKTGAP